MKIAGCQSGKKLPEVYFHTSSDTQINYGYSVENTDLVKFCLSFEGQSRLKLMGFH